MPRLTLKAVSKAIKEKHGHDVILHKGEGYYYFYSDEAGILDYASGTSVYVGYLGAFDLEGWVRQFEDIIEDIDMDYVEECKQIKLSHAIKLRKGV